MEFGAAIISGLRSLEADSPCPQTLPSTTGRSDCGCCMRIPAAGRSTPWVRYPAGLKGRPRQHTAARTIIVFEGQADANGRIIGPGSYAHFPAGDVMRHQAAGDSPCLFVLLFHGPSDVRLAGKGAPGQPPGCSSRPPGSGCANGAGRCGLWCWPGACGRARGRRLPVHAGFASRLSGLVASAACAHRDRGRVSPGPGHPHRRGHTVHGTRHAPGALR